VPPRLIGSGIEWNPDNKQIAFICNDGTIKIVDAETGRQIRSINALQQDGRSGVVVGGLMYSTDGKRLFSGGSAGGNAYAVRMWDVATGRKIWDYETLNKVSSNYLGMKFWDMIESMGLTRDGQRIIVYTTRGNLFLNSATGEELNPSNKPDHYSEVYSPDGKRFLTINGGIIVADAETGKSILKIGKPPYYYSLSFGSSRNELTAVAQEKTYVWNIETGRLIRIINGKNEYVAREEVKSPDGKRILKPDGNYRIFVRVVDASNGSVLTILPAHGNDARGIFSPDGKWIITASDDGAVRIYSAETFVEKARLIVYDDGEWLALTPDNCYSASANGDKYLNVRIGSTVTGIDRYRSIYNKPAIVQARLSNSGRMMHSNNVYNLALNPAGTRIASASFDGTAKLWDLESGKLIRTFSNHKGVVGSVTWSPDGKILATSGAEDTAIKIWDTDSGKEVRTIATGQKSFIEAVRYSPNGKRIASCSDDKTIKIWDAETGKEIRLLTGHSADVWDISWSPDSKSLASASKDKTIKIWNVENGQVMRTITGHNDGVTKVAYSPDGKRLLSASDDKTIKIWDAETGRQIRSISVPIGKVHAIAWHPNGRRFASGTDYAGEQDNGKHIAIWDAETGESIRTINELGTIYSITWTPDGRRLVASSNFSDAQMIKVFDAQTGKEL
jgi:WD40 repeat protein